VKKASKTIFTCQSCGSQSPPSGWGKCADCGAWDSFVEERQATGRLARESAMPLWRPRPVPIDSIDIEHEQRLLTAIQEFDRVLGGGLVAGSLV